MFIAYVSTLEISLTVRPIRETIVLSLLALRLHAEVEGVPVSKYNPHPFDRTVQRLENQSPKNLAGKTVNKLDNCTSFLLV